MAVQAGRDIRHGNAYFGGSAGAAGQTHYARLRLHQHVVGTLLAVRTIGSVAGDAAPDEPWMALRELLIAETQPLDRARHEVMDKDIRAFQQPGASLQAVRLFQVQDNAA